MNKERLEAKWVFILLKYTKYEFYIRNCNLKET